MSLKSSNMSMVGGVLAATGAGLCCAGPLVLLMMGISGAWISNLTLLAPYKPIFILLVLVAFGYAGWKIYRPATECEPGTACATPKSRRRRQIIFWVAAAISLLLTTSSYWIIWFA